MLNGFGPRKKELPNGYIELIIDPSRIWKKSLNMIYWPTDVRVRSYLEMHKHKLVKAEDEILVIEQTNGQQFEIQIERKLTVGRGARRVSIVMGPFNDQTPPEIESLKQEIADLFVKGKKIDWRGPEDMRGWWE
ncbi:MAG: hypothetical protein AAGD96_27785 [Chloroflexota bacterium]